MGYQTLEEILTAERYIGTPEDVSLLADRIRVAVDRENRPIPGLLAGSKQETSRDMVFESRVMECLQKQSDWAASVGTLLSEISGKLDNIQVRLWNLEHGVRSVVSVSEKTL